MSDGENRHRNRQQCTHIDHSLHGGEALRPFEFVNGILFFDDNLQILNKINQDYLPLWLRIDTD